MFPYLWHATVPLLILFNDAAMFMIKKKLLQCGGWGDKRKINLPCHNHESLRVLLPLKYPWKSQLKYKTPPDLGNFKYDISAYL